MGTWKLKYSFYLHAIPIKNEKLSLREMYISLYWHNKSSCIALIEKNIYLEKEYYQKGSTDRLEGIMFKTKFMNDIIQDDVSHKFNVLNYITTI